MPWFKVDDNFVVSRKVFAIPRADRLLAIGLWTYAGNHAARLLTNGHIPKDILDEIEPPTQIVETLIRVGLWDVDSDGEYWFHDWGDYQPSAQAYIEKQAAIREKRSQDGKLGAAKRWGNRNLGNPNGVPIGKGLGSDSPEPEPEPEPRDKYRGSRITEGFEVTESMFDWFEKQSFTIDLDEETSKFVDHYLAAPGDKGIRADWIATWRSWMKRAQSYRKDSQDLDPWAGKEHLGFAE